jgi:hypothetical protein
MTLESANAVAHTISMITIEIYDTINIMIINDSPRVTFQIVASLLE